MQSWGNCRDFRPIVEISVGVTILKKWFFQHYLKQNYQTKTYCNHKILLNWILKIVWKKIYIFCISFFFTNEKIDPSNLYCLAGGSWSIEVMGFSGWFSPMVDENACMKSSAAYCGFHFYFVDNVICLYLNIWRCAGVSSTWVENSWKITTEYTSGVDFISFFIFAGAPVWQSVCPAWPLASLSASWETLACVAPPSSQGSSWEWSSSLSLLR